MTMPLSRTTGNTLEALILAGLLGTACLLGATSDKKTPPPAKPAPSAKPPATAAHPAGGAAPPRGSANGPSTGHPGYSGPSANHPAYSAPSANHPTAVSPRPNGAGNPVQRPGESTPVRPAIDQGRDTNLGRPGGAAHQDIEPRGVAHGTARNGVQYQVRNGGQLRQMHDPKTGIDIHHNLSGGRRVSVEHADHSRTFYERGRPGFVQRPYSYRGHDFARRTYYYHGRAYDHFYHGYMYRGMYVNVYAPYGYYRPAFYGWAYYPWGAPASYQWGFAGAPWYGYYGYYFAPYPSYPSASYWLTDYMIQSDLQTAYAAHSEAGEADGAPPSASGAPQLTPDVKQQIADEVRNQLALEGQEAQQNSQQQDIDPGSSGIDRMFSDAAHGKTHLFVVGTSLDLIDNSGMECPLSDGDVLALRTAPSTDATVVDLVVLSSKGGQECQKEAVVSVKLDDLQEMQNHMRETIDQGLQELQSSHGKSGLPSPPTSAAAPPTPAQYAAVAPPPDPNAGNEIQQQAQEGDQAERSLAAQTAQPGAPQ